MIDLEAGDLEHFERLLAQQLGFSAGASSRARVLAALRRRMATTGVDSYSIYASRFASSSSARAEITALAGDLTVGETYFFRGADHFRALRDEALAAAEGRPLRILSAGCASGEEAYTLAMVLSEAGIACDDGVTPPILGVDVNAASIARARTATYGAWALRETPAEARERFFDIVGKEVVVKPEIRRLARFEERNLLEPDPELWRPGAFDVVFCRNVLIYLTPEAVASLLERIAWSLVPGGFLFLGHAETPSGASANLRLQRSRETFFYRR